jgi:hypothetical protein
MLVVMQQQQSIKVVVVEVVETPLVLMALQQQVVMVVKDMTHQISSVNRLVRHAWQVVAVVEAQPLMELAEQAVVVMVGTITAQPIRVAVVVAVLVVMAVLVVQESSM